MFEGPCRSPAVSKLSKRFCLFLSFLMFLSLVFTNLQIRQQQQSYLILDIVCELSLPVDLNSHWIQCDVPAGCGLGIQCDVSGWDIYATPRTYNRSRTTTMVTFKVIASMVCMLFSRPEIDFSKRSSLDSVATFAGEQSVTIGELEEFPFPLRHQLFQVCETWAPKAFWGKDI